LNFKYW